MKISVASRCHRNLRHLKGYEKQECGPRWIGPEHGKICARYSSDQNEYWITDRGILSFQDTDIEEIKYFKISKIPSAESKSQSHLSLQLENGKSITLNLANAAAVFAFQTFLMRVLGDLEDTAE